jgi:hypothetical protein
MDAWSPFLGIALDLAGKLLMGIAIGLGVGIRTAIAG